MLAYGGDAIVRGLPPGKVSAACGGRIAQDIAASKCWPRWSARS